MAKSHVNGAIQAPLTRRQIVYLLKRHKVSQELWGTRKFRSLDDLVLYHQQDKLYFRNGSSKLCVIDVHAAVVLVCHRFNKRWFELYEDRQEFDNGAVLKRGGFNGVAETLKRTELVVDGARRCLREELNFHDPSLYQLSDCIRVEEWKPKESEPEGYMEREKGRTIYFKWRERGQTDLSLSI